MEEAVLAASDPAVEDWFGISVAIGGDLVVVGAEGDDDAGDCSGAAYIFRREGLTWAQEAKLAASDANSRQYFGVSVSISAGRVLVGADGSSGGGAGYVFERQAGDWIEQAKLTAWDQSAGARLGFSVTLDGRLAVLGAVADDHAGGHSGSAYLFAYNDATWLQKDKLVASDAGTGDLFGFSAAICGHVAVVGNGGRSAYVYPVFVDIPAASGWGLTLLALCVLTAGTIALRRKRAWVGSDRGGGKQTQACTRDGGARPRFGERRTASHA